MTAASLRVEGVTAGYGPVRALVDVSVDVPDGAVVAVLGGNGAGKSTLLRAVSRTLAFHGGALRGGSVSFGGRRLDGLAAAELVAAGVVLVPEGRQMFARMTVADNLRAGALGARGGARGRARGGERDRAWGGARARADRRAPAHARVHGLFPVLRQRAQQRAGLLSGGEQQMLALGRALMAEPRLLLLDEPTLGLAPMAAARIADTIREINAQGTSVLLVEQNAAVALKLASSAYVLETGRVALAGPAAELAVSDEVRRRYLGVVDETAAQDAESVSTSVPRLGRWPA
ncbi:ABC transporter ATP-binding protein [Streptomyces synnematoformans]|uniref:ABC transporter ATP-binding protein n=1 Tax=Streptomyces synnematoformans TaxID=415721 RepID=A0ABN2XEZ6_9ACTN